MSITFIDSSNLEYTYSIDDSDLNIHVLYTSHNNTAKVQSVLLVRGRETISNPPQQYHEDMNLAESQTIEKLKHRFASVT